MDADADVRGGDGRRVVHAITHHHHRSPGGGLELFDKREFPLGRHGSEGVRRFKGKRPAHRRHRIVGITTQHDGPPTASTQLLQRFERVVAYSIAETCDRHDYAIDGDVDGRECAIERVDHVFQRFVERHHRCAHESWRTDAHRVAVHGALDSAAGDMPRRGDRGGYKTGPGATEAIGQRHCAGPTHGHVPTGSARTRPRAVRKGLCTFC